MSKVKSYSDHQLTLKKLNDFGKELDSMNEGLIQFANSLNVRFQLMEIAMDKMLKETNIEIVEFVPEQIEEFNKKYAILFHNYFVDLETEKMVSVKFPEKENDELLDDSK